MKMSAFFRDDRCKNSDFTCMVQRMRKDGNKPLVFLIYVHVNGTANTLGEFRKVIEDWDKENKEYTQVPFEGVEWTWSRYYIPISDLKTIPYKIYDIRK